MHPPTSRLCPLAVVAAAALVLGACGSGGGGEGSDKAAAKDSAPSKADFKQAQMALTELKADYQAVYDAGTQVQKTSVAYFKSHPDGTADDAALEPATKALDAAVQKRDDAIDEVEKLQALKDPDVAKAYKTYSAKAEKGDQFHDSLFAAFPLLEQVAAQVNKVAENIDFQKQLNSLSPVPEFLALEKVVAGRAT